jgi:hypothetical protein
LEWTSRLEEIFEDIKKVINECPELFFLNDYSPIHLYTDASDEGIGAYLTQVVESIECPIAFINKAFDRGMSDWDTPQKIFIMLWIDGRILLRDREFQIHNDHENLRKVNDDYDNNKKVQRWPRCFQNYSYNIVSRKGIDNTVADMFSRLCV